MLWTTGSKITTTRDGMPYVNKSKEARLKDARLLSLLRLLVMATEESRDMIQVIKKWELNLQLFTSNEMVALSHISEACKNVNMSWRFVLVGSLG